MSSSGCSTTKSAGSGSYSISSRALKNDFFVFKLIQRIVHNFRILTIPYLPIQKLSLNRDLELIKTSKFQKLKEAGSGS